MAKTKEQMQIMVLGAILAGGALIAGAYFVLVPLVTSYQESREVISDLERKLETARAFTQKAGQFRAEYREALSEIETHSNYIPKPVLGNYLLAMEWNLKQCLDGLDIELDGIGDSGTADLADNSLFRFYKIRMNLFAGTADFAKLLDNIYKMNPLVAITELSINPNEKDPMKHRISMDISWMIWKTPFDMPAYITTPPLLEEESGAPADKPEQEDPA